MKTFDWYDFETFGINPKATRIAQFAGIRTDENLNILDEQMFYKLVPLTQIGYLEKAHEGKNLMLGAVLQIHQSTFQC